MALRKKFTFTRWCERNLKTRKMEPKRINIFYSRWGTTYWYRIYIYMLYKVCDLNQTWDVRFYQWYWTLLYFDFLKLHLNGCQWLANSVRNIMDARLFPTLVPHWYFLKDVRTPSYPIKCRAYCLVILKLILFHVNVEQEIDMIIICRWN